MQIVVCHVVRKDSSLVRFDRAEKVLIIVLFHSLKPFTDKGGEEETVTNFRKCHLLKPDRSNPVQYSIAQHVTTQHKQYSKNTMQHSYTTQSKHAHTHARARARTRTHTHTHTHTRTQRERERERERERQAETDSYRQTDRQAHTDRHRKTDIGNQAETDTDRQRHRQTDRGTQRQKPQSQIDRQRHRRHCHHVKTKA